MSNYSNNEVQLPGVELAAVMNGTWVNIGTLPFNPVKIIFDNQGLAPVAISVNNAGATTWRTFPAGEALVLDNDLESFSKGTVFYGNGASGTFSISYTYIKPS
jgi:hypothetical protein